MGITKGQKLKLKKMIEYHVKSQVKLSWAGSYPPDEADEIEEESTETMEIEIKNTSELGIPNDIQELIA